MLCRESVRITGAGRTDAGVHASGQVISFRSTGALDIRAMGRGVNALLPRDITVSELEVVGDEFNARFSATGRQYEYRIRNGPWRDPLDRHRELWLAPPLDGSALDLAAAQLIGRRDYSAFASGPGGVREVRTARWERDGALLRFEISADGFLRGMVRAIVGTMIWIGRGKVPVGDLEAIMASRDRSQAGPSAPPYGLCLVNVEYGERQLRQPRRSEDDEDGSE